MKELKQVFWRLIRTLSKTNEDGFTLIEALIIIFLFGVLAVTVAGSVLIGQQVVNRVVTSTHTSLKLVQLDSYVRGLMADIKVPFWLAKLDYNYEATSLEIPYLDGNPDKSLVIKNEEKGFFIGFRDESSDLSEVKEELIYFGPYWDCSLEVEEEDELIRSVTLFVTQEQDTQEVEINVFLSTNAFWDTGL